MRDRIHISQETADLLIAAGKNHWIIPREDVVVAKGKGELRTFWLLPREDMAGTSTKASSETHEDANSQDIAPEPEQPSALPMSHVKNDKIQRMIDWNCDILLQLLRLIGAKRQASRRSSAHGNMIETELDHIERDISEGGLPVDEIVEVIHLPEFDSSAYEKDPRFVEIGEAVEAQLHSFVTIIASMYRYEPILFQDDHCFVTLYGYRSRMLTIHHCFFFFLQRHTIPQLRGTKEEGRAFQNHLECNEVDLTPLLSSFISARIPRQYVDCQTAVAYCCSDPADAGQ